MVLTVNTLWTLYCSYAEAKHNEESFQSFLFSWPCLSRQGHIPPSPRPFSSFRALRPAQAQQKLPFLAEGADPYETRAPSARRPRPAPWADSRAPAVSRGGAVGGAGAGPRAPVRACARAAGGPVKPAALARDPGPARLLGGSVCLSVRGCHHGGRGQSGAPGLRSHHPVPAAHVREGAHPGMSRRHSLLCAAPCSVAAVHGAWGSAPAVPGLQSP